MSTFSKRIGSQLMNKTPRARLTSRALLETLESRLLLTAAPPVPDALTAFFYKQIHDSQTSAAAPVVLSTNGYSNGALVYDNPSKPGFVQSANIGAGFAPSNPFNIPAVPGAIPGSTNFLSNTNYNSQAAVDAIFPNGQYALAINSVNDGLHTFILTLTNNWNGYTSANYPNAPHIDDYTNLQAADATTPITVTWDPMQVPQGPGAPSFAPALQPGNANDYEQLQITDSTGKIVYQTPVLGAIPHLDGNSTSVTIPAGTLTRGQTYSADLVFTKIAAQNTTTYPGVLGVAGFSQDTAFTICTLPVQPSVVVITPPPVPIAASQPINITVTIATTVLDPNTLNSTPPVTVTDFTQNATGTVTLFDGITTLGTAALTNGSATFTETLAGGSHALSASYSGDSTYLPSGPSGTVHYSTVPTFTFPPSGQLIVTALDAGSIPLVKVFDATTGQMAFDFLAYDSAYSGPVHIAIGDVTGDGIPDIITSTGNGGQPLINVFNGFSGSLVTNFYAYSPNFTGGVEIAVANVLGLPTAQIVTTTDAGGQPLVNIFNSAGTLLSNFFAYSPDYIGGVRVAAARTNTGIGEIITAPLAPTSSSVVNIFNAANGSLIANLFESQVSVTGIEAPLRSYFLAAADANADGTPEIFLGIDAGSSPEVAAFDGASRTLLNSFLAYNTSFLGGVRIAALPTTPGHSILVTAPGPGGQPQINLFDPLTGTLLRSFNAYDSSMTTGLFVAAGISST